jgi:aryl-alcohol dehydrogenase-like predicted oxidoreductase
MAHVTRRDFFKSSLAAATLARTGFGQTAKTATKRSATDWVTLGNSGVKVTRLAFGTGTNNGHVQANLGQAEFTRMVRHAYDNGIRFFETAESYATPAMLGEALKGLPRDSYRLMTKYTTGGDDNPLDKIDGFRKTLNTDYFDILLMHCMQSPLWPDQTKRWQDGFSEAKEKKIILAKGASVHGLPALSQFPDNKWLDIAMIRMNHKGVLMDGPTTRSNQGDVNQVVDYAAKVHGRGVGVISMKLVGEGRFTDPEDREASLKFAMGLGTVDAVTIGYKSVAEIDEAIERLNRVLNA